MSTKLQVLVCVLCALPFCAWPQEPAGRWVTLTADGVLTIIGVSSRAHLVHNHTGAYPHTPDTGLAAHYGGIAAYPVKMLGVHTPSIP
jgi:hypothetical protein